jgi:hypothetical protein
LLQSVVEAIENVGFNFHTHKARVRIELDDNGLMAGLKDPEIEVRSSTVDFDKKLATYVAVVRFVTWYNVLQIGKI